MWLFDILPVYSKYMDGPIIVFVYDYTNWKCCAKSFKRFGWINLMKKNIWGGSDFLTPHLLCFTVRDQYREKKIGQL